MPDGGRELVPADGPLEYVLVRADASYVHLDVTGRDATPSQLTVLVDTLPGSGGADYRVVVDREAGTARAYVRRELDPIRLYTRERIDYPEGDDPWHLFRQLMNRELTDRRRAPRPGARRRRRPGRGRAGTRRTRTYDSRATWQVDEAHHTVRLRLPWPMLGLADPSSRTALGPGRPARLVPIDGLGLTFETDGSRERLDFSWPAWNSIGHTERLDAGADVLAEAFRDLAPCRPVAVHAHGVDLSLVHACATSTVAVHALALEPSLFTRSASSRRSFTRSYPGVRWERPVRVGV